jgi:hypothetical protein
VVHDAAAPEARHRHVVEHLLEGRAVGAGALGRREREAKAGGEGELMIGRLQAVILHNLECKHA